MLTKQKIKSVIRQKDDLGQTLFFIEATCRISNFEIMANKYSKDDLTRIAVDAVQDHLYGEIISYINRSIAVFKNTSEAMPGNKLKDDIDRNINQLEELLKRLKS